MNDPARRAKLIAIALCSLMYDLKNGVVFEEETLALAEREGIVLELNILAEVEELSGAYDKGILRFREALNG